MIDLASLEEVEKALAFDGGNVMQNGAQISKLCAVCYAGIPCNGTDLRAWDAHANYHRAMAQALTAAAEIAATIKSLTGGSP